jgi:hypothetical protein
MMTHEYYEKQFGNNGKIDESRLPDAITDQFKDVDKIKDQITQAKNKADEAKKKSEELHKLGPWGGGKKAAIEDLQESSKMLAIAQEQTAIAQGLFFEYQEKLAKATKFVFEIGINNMANTDTIIRQLQRYMEGASADELDELKQAEINAVIDRLLQQESIQKKQEKMWEQIDSLDLELAQQHEINERQAEEIKHNKEKNEEHDRLLAETKKKNEEQDRELKLQVQKDEEHDQLLAETKKKDEEQDRELKLQVQKDEEHDRLLAEAKKKDEEQDRELKLQVQKDEEHDRLLAEAKKKNEEQDEELDRQIKNDERHDLLFEKQKEINDSFSKEFEMLSDKFLSLQNSVKEVESQKASKSINIISLLIALAALGLSIAQFLI